MKKFVVISGKGGTGKTTISAALAHLAARDREIVMADCDIDASNLPVLLPPEIENRKDFIGSSRAVKTKECSRCGRCAEVCRFGAIDSTGEVNLVKCEGCGSCVYVCPDGALEIEEYKTGTIFTSRTRFGPMIHAELERGEEASGKIVIEVKKMLADYEKEAEVAIIDGSPGTGCPVIASLRGCDGALVVTEPTVSGLHDLKRVLEVAERLGVEPFVCINKSDLNKQVTNEIRRYCQQQDYVVAGDLPYDERVDEALRNRRTLIESENKIFGEKLQQIWTKLAANIL